MKLVVREYLASLKERGELDAILPDLLSELGFTVFSRPGTGTTQRGVDVAAVGKDGDGEKKVFLFSVKRGDLTRQEWDGSPQALRSSLNEILDAYIPNRLPSQYKAMKIVICICLGGGIREQVREQVSTYQTRNTTDQVSFQEWDGDKLAEMILRGLLREEVLPKSYRSSFQKSVALVDEPDVSFDHFSNLVVQLRSGGALSNKERVRVGRQIFLCSWILYVWARDVENLEAPYKATEFALLHVWDLLRPFIGGKTAANRDLTQVLHQLIQLHLQILGELLDQKVVPHAAKRHGLTMAVESREYADINLRLFELLGRVAMMGHWLDWLHWFEKQSGREPSAELTERARGLCDTAHDLIDNNPALAAPLRDDHAIEITLLLLLHAATQKTGDRAAAWLEGMTNRIHFTVRSHGRYPCIFGNFRDLLLHPRERTEDYRKEATAGSILYPVMIAWMSAFGLHRQLDLIRSLMEEDIPHCTLQLWLPDESTEEQIFVGEREHGLAVCDLPFSNSGKDLLELVKATCEQEKTFEEISCVKAGYWPILLLACRHYRFPIPPQLWIDLLAAGEGGE